jgi:transcriptional regulator with XRE-family HTH domain
VNDNNIKYIREELEMTQDELGLVFGVTRKTISGWENAYDNMPLPKMVRFSNEYKYSLDYISGLSRKNNYSILNKPNPVKIGKKLKQIRTNLQLTQQQIADECMISQTTYSNYEKGLYLITSLSLYTICYNHNLSMDNFLK